MRTAPLLAAYASDCPSPTTPTTEETLTIDPPGVPSRRIVNPVLAAEEHAVEVHARHARPLVVAPALEGVRKRLHARVVDDSVEAAVVVGYPLQRRVPRRLVDNVELDRLRRPELV